MQIAAVKTGRRRQPSGLKRWWWAQFETVVSIINPF
jgi:hypothetical protein